MARLRSLVETEGACALPGCTIKYESFTQVMWRAVQRGFVRHNDAIFLADGLRYGFKLGVDTTKMHGHRQFNNYKSAVEAAESVSKAVQERVDAHKTVDLGPSTSRLELAVRSLFTASCIFPMGAVGKSVEEYVNEKRPTDDHTRTGLNAATEAAEGAQAAAHGAQVAAQDGQAAVEAGTTTVTNAVAAGTTTVTNAVAAGTTAILIDNLATRAAVRRAEAAAEAAADHAALAALHGAAAPAAAAPPAAPSAADPPAATPAPASPLGSVPLGAVNAASVTSAPPAAAPSAGGAENAPPASAPMDVAATAAAAHVERIRRAAAKPAKRPPVPPSDASGAQRQRRE